MSSPPPPQKIDYGISDIKGLRFEVASANEIRAVSCVEVTTANIHDSGIPLDNGLRSPKFGPSAGRACGTCQAKYSSGKCTHGHPGHYTLSTPLYNVMFTRHICAWLKLVCKCGKIHAEPAKTLHGLLNTKIKGECECGQRPLSSACWNRNTQTITIGKTGPTFSAVEALQLFNRVPEDHPIFAHISHPKHMISTVVQIPSIRLRPCIGGMHSEIRGESDLTYLLVKLVRADQTLRRKVKGKTNANGEFLGDKMTHRSLVFVTQNAYTNYLDTNMSKNNNSNKGASIYACASQKLRGKDQLLRGAMAGFRCQQTARCVVTPFPNMRCDRVGVPKFIADNMTVTITVTSWNKTALLDMARKKRAAYIVKSTGETIDLKEAPPPEWLETGWKVARFLVDGDWVLLNRQPTLSKKSIMACRIFILNEGDKTIKLPYCLTTSYNADFDGDEMNIHVLQTPEARAEAWLLSPVRNILDAADGRAIICPIQGGRLGPWLMSDSNATLTRKQWFVCVGKATEAMQIRAVKCPPKSFPCKASRFWSMALPEGYTNIFKEVEIRDGILLCGRVNKSVLQRLVHDIVMDCGNEVAADFIQGAEVAANVFNAKVRPTTIFLDELCPSEDLQRKCAEAVVETKRLFEISGETNIDEHIDFVNRRISDIVERHPSKHTGFINCVQSGAKGSMHNFCMIKASLGRMASGDDAKGVFRLPEGTWRGKRCFTNQKKKQIFQDSFVTSGFATKMKSTEYAMHAKKGRASMIESTELVPSTGYGHRKLSAFLSPLSTGHNGVVYNLSDGSIVCFRYGGDGRSSYCTEWETFSSPTPKSIYAVGGASANTVQKLNARLATDIAAVYKMFPDAGTRVFDVAVSVRRVFDAAEKREFEMVTDAKLNEWQRRVQAIVSRHTEHDQELIALWLRIHLHPYRLEKFTDTAVDNILEEIDKRMYKSKVECCENVGLMVASALAAKSTQFTLNAFHNIGRQGVDYAEFQRLINLTKKRKFVRVTFKLKLPRDEWPRWAKRKRLLTLGDLIMERGMPQADDDLSSYYAWPDDPGETPFRSITRLVVHHDDAFAVSRVLRVMGMRTAYVRRQDGKVLFHTNAPLKPGSLAKRVSGSLAGCRVEGMDIVCSEMPPTSLEEVDTTTIRTTNFQQMQAMFGIEAARRCIHEELKRMLKSFNVKLLDRHLELLCDAMTHKGGLQGCNRHGMKQKSPERALWLATFERPTEPLTQAAVNKYTDPVKGHTDRLVLGQPMHSPYITMYKDHEAEKKYTVWTKETHNIMEEDFDFGGLDGGADSWMPTQNAF